MVEALFLCNDFIFKAQFYDSKSKKCKNRRGNSRLKSKRISLFFTSITLYLFENMCIIGLGVFGYFNICLELTELIKNLSFIPGNKTIKYCT